MVGIKEPLKFADILEYSDNKDNIAEHLDSDDLNLIGEEVVQGFDIDDKSLDSWKKKNEIAIKLAMQVEEVKNEPWPNCANVKYPILTTACIQFSSRALPNIIKGGAVVKSKVLGSDSDGRKAARAERVSNHMSWQLTEEMDNWIDDLDQGLTTLPAVGCMFKKTYFDGAAGKNVSEMIMPKNFVVHNYTKSLETAARATHILELSPNLIEERIRANVYIDFDLGTPTSSINEGDNRGGEDEDAPHIFLEMHKWLDLDDDGYKEPYIVTVHKDTSKVVRILARFEKVTMDEDGKTVRKIKPKKYFTKIPFIPSMDGSFYDLGFGHLVGPINRAANQTINQLLDAGTLNNRQGGFLGAGLQLNRGRGGGAVRFKLGEWKPIKVPGGDIAKNIFPMPTKEPSMVLFSLLGMLIQAGEKMSSVTDVLSGESPGADVPATTTLALIEQGLKVFTAIYGRIHRGLKKEFKLLFKLNSEYLDIEKYFTYQDKPQKVILQDYKAGDLDIIPVSDEAEITDIQRLVKAQGLIAMVGQGLNDQVIRRRYIEALGTPDIEEIMNAPEPAPDPELMLKVESAKLERSKFEFEMMMARMKMVEQYTKSVKNLADAEAKEAGPQIEMYKREVDSITKLLTADLSVRAKNAGQQQGATPNNQGGVGGMAQ